MNDPGGKVRRGRGKKRRYAERGEGRLSYPSSHVVRFEGQVVGFIGFVKYLLHDP
jgi:hypothetical protein